MTKDANLLGYADGGTFMRVIRVTADLTVPDLDEAEAFYTGFLGLDAQDMGLDWVRRVVVPSSGEHIQLLSQDDTGPENPPLLRPSTGRDRAQYRSAPRPRRVTPVRDDVTDREA
jgi:catechol 2,3-dioxygenase-like lactoylglutathione lyase family enzyme